MEITDEQIKEAADQMFPIDNMGELGFIEGAKWMREQQPKWIRVEDKLPEHEGWYSIKWEQGSVNISFFTGNDFIDPGITHWMPLPEPPTSTT